MSWAEVKHSINDSLGTDNFIPLNRQIYNYSVPINAKFETVDKTIYKGVTNTTFTFSNGYKKVIAVYGAVSATSSANFTDGNIIVEIDGVQYNLLFKSTSGFGRFCIPNSITYIGLGTSYCTIELSNADEDNKRDISFEYKNNLSITIPIRSQASSMPVRLSILYVE